ncbi:hypothetical protein CC86DRAFT_372895 [Ophiobolus disseminans]|uniref:Uncharacterized protein n=1 Tax=Ophiobolus disseminans TaxID=1469910 RepID=A0A6A6ZQ24_9PLEO|nr:hypothetical protein CC86DRAFT_372895 [Ophiobolus disseminans]
MRFSTLTTATLASVSLASARIIGFSAPSTLAPNSTFTFNLTTENYIQRVADVAVSWGYTLPTETNPTGYKYSLGSFAESAYLGPDRSNIITGVVVNATVPVGLNSSSYFGKDVVLSVAVTSLYGASGGPVTQGWNVTVRIGAEDGGEWVDSGREGGWIENGSCQ